LLEGESSLKERVKAKGKRAIVKVKGDFSGRGGDKAASRGRTFLTLLFVVGGPMGKKNRAIPYGNLNHTERGETTTMKY